MDVGLGAMEDDVRVQNYTIAVLEGNKRKGACLYPGEAGKRREEEKVVLCPGGALSAG